MFGHCWLLQQEGWGVATCFYQVKARDTANKHPTKRRTILTAKNDLGPNVSGARNCGWETKIQPPGPILFALCLERLSVD